MYQELGDLAELLDLDPGDPRLSERADWALALNAGLACHDLYAAREKILRALRELDR